MSEPKGLMRLPGAVEASWPDEGVAAHYGDPMREQRAAEESAALVDRSNRGVLRITGHTPKDQRAGVRECECGYKEKQHHQRHGEAVLGN